MKGIKAHNRNVKNFEKFQEEVDKEKENNEENNEEKFKRLGSQSTLRSSSSKTMHKSIWNINNICSSRKRFNIRAIKISNTV